MSRIVLLLVLEEVTKEMRGHEYHKNDLIKLSTLTHSLGTSISTSDEVYEVMSHTQAKSPFTLALGLGPNWFGQTTSIMWFTESGFQSSALGVFTQLP